MLEPSGIDMSSSELVCVVQIPDSFGKPSGKGSAFQASLTPKIDHGSKLLWEQLERYAKANGRVMRFVNNETYDDFWALDFAFGNHPVASIQVNLRRIFELGTEWGLWTSEPSEFTNGIHGFLEGVPTFEVRMTAHRIE